MLKEIFACLAISTQPHAFPSCYKGHSVFEGGTSFLLRSAATTVKGKNLLSACCSGLTSVIKSVGKRAGSQSPCQDC